MNGMLGLLVGEKARSKEKQDKIKVIYSRFLLP